MKMLLILVLSCTVLLLVSCSDETSITAPEVTVAKLTVTQGTDSWDWSTIPSSEDMKAISCSPWGASIVGAGSLTKFSGDGRTWATLSRNGSADYLATVMMDDVCLAVGSGPFASISGYDFAANPPTNQQGILRAVAWSGETIVAVGDQGTLVTSPDGYDWTSQAAICAGDLSSISWTGDHFYCGGHDGALYASVNGTVWKVEESPIESTITALVMTSTGLYATTLAGGLWKMDNGIWGRQYQDTGIPMRGLAEYGTTMVAVGDQASMLVLGDAGEWKQFSLDVDSDFRSIAACEIITVVGSNGVLLISEDGESWELRPSFSPNSLADISSNGSSYLSVGNEQILFSNDGHHWRQVWHGNLKRIYSVAWAEDHYVACGADGLLLTSVTGEDWVQSSLPLAKDFWSVHWTGTQVLFGGDDGTLLSTSDYQIWVEENVSATGAIFGMAQSPGATVAVTTAGEICFSQDGHRWDVSDTGTRFEDIIWTGSSFLALAGDAVFQSFTGFDWSHFEIPQVSTWFGAIANDGQRTYVAGYQYRILWSDDLVTWQSDESGFEYSDWARITHLGFNSMHFDGEDLFVVGDAGVALVSK